MTRGTTTQRVITSLSLLAVLSYSDAWFFAFATAEVVSVVHAKPTGDLPVDSTDETDSDDEPSCGAPPIDVWSRGGGDAGARVEFVHAGGAASPAARFEKSHTPTLGIRDHAEPELSKSVRFDPNHNIHGPPRII
jgi:hypothetical protein